MSDINSIGNARLIIKEVSKVIVGKDESLIKILLAIIAGGHILMEDIPGVGKTTMAISISKALGLDYNRVQFTPDVLPSDITGYSIYDKESGKMNYQKGSILCNLSPIYHKDPVTVTDGRKTMCNHNTCALHLVERF